MSGRRPVRLRPRCRGVSAAASDRHAGAGPVPSRGDHRLRRLRLLESDQDRSHRGPPGTPARLLGAAQEATQLDGGQTVHESPELPAGLLLGPCPEGAAGDDAVQRPKHPVETPKRQRHIVFGDHAVRRHASVVVVVQVGLLTRRRAVGRRQALDLLEWIFHFRYAFVMPSHHLGHLPEHRSEQAVLVAEEGVYGARGRARRLGHAAHRHGVHAI